MPNEMDDDFNYDDLFASSRRIASNSCFDEDFVPIGAGKKRSQIDGVESPVRSADPPKPKKNNPPAAEEHPVEKKKPVSAASAASGKKKRPSAVSAGHPKDDGTGPDAARRRSGKTGGTSPEKKAAAKKPAPKKRPASSKKKSVKEEMLTMAYLGVTAAGGGIKRFFSRKRNIAITAVLVALLVILGCSVAVKAIYQSKTMFADNGRELDDSAIAERLVTSEQNRDKVTYFLIVGVDKSSKLTDCIWVMCFDNAAHRMNVIQIPRDTYVGDDSIKPHKINAVYESPQTVKWCEKCNMAIAEDEITSEKHAICGTKITNRTESNINSLIRCVNNRLCLPVDHYVLFDFEGFEKVIDALGGVDITLEEEMKVYPNKTDYVTLHAGLNHLDGETALKFMRNRKIYKEGDLGRVKAQRRIIHAMLEKVDGMSTGEALKVLTAAYGNFKTDMSLQEIRSFLAPIKKCGADSLHMFEMPGADYWVKGHPSYYVCDEEKTAEEINRYMLPYSEKITADDIYFPDLGY